MPDFVAVRMHGPPKERTKTKAILGSTTVDVLITNYETYQLEEGWFKARRWNCVVLDEGHKIKNSETQISHSVQGIGSLSRIGTLTLLL